MTDTETHEFVIDAVRRPAKESIHVDFKDSRISLSVSSFVRPSISPDRNAGILGLVADFKAGQHIMITASRDSPKVFAIECDGVTLKGREGQPIAGLILG